MKWIQQDFIKLTRSFLAFDNGRGTRPLLNNEPGYEILKNISYSRGGSFNNFTTILSYKGIDLIEVNTSKNIPSKRLHQNTPEAEEFNELLNKLFDENRKIIEETSKETKIPKEKVENIISESKERPLYVTQTQEQIREMVIEKNKYHKKPEPGQKIESLRRELRNIPQSVFNNDGSDDIILPDIPKEVIDEIVSDSVEKIHTRLEDKATSIEALTITDQESREASMFLNPTGTVDEKIDSLETQGEHFRLEALKEADPRREQLYKNISETAYLKADYIRLTEKDEQPENNEAKEIIEETADENESINNLKRLERFKEWAKENLLGVSALAISIAGIITTIVVGARKAISKGAKVTSKFAKAVYNLGKKLGPLLAPILNVIAQALSWAAKGLAWLAPNLRILALAFAWFVYDQHKERRKK